MRLQYSKKEKNYDENFWNTEYCHPLHSDESSRHLWNIADLVRPYHLPLLLVHLTLHKWGVSTMQYALCKKLLFYACAIGAPPKSSCKMRFMHDYLMHYERVYCTKIDNINWGQISVPMICHFEMTAVSPDLIQIS